MPSPYGVTGVFAGETEAVHAHTLRRAYEQYLVPVVGQADILITGIPYISPYNVNSFLNPLLVQVMANGYLFNLYKGVPMVKKGGTMIILHPCTDQFDNEHHAPYIEFVHRLLPETRDAMELHRRFEANFAANPAYLGMYRQGHAYHPTHPFFMWYWGEAGRQHLGPDDRGRRRQRVHPQAPRLGDGPLHGRGAAHGQDHRASAPGDPRAALAPHRDGRDLAGEAARLHPPRERLRLKPS